MDSAGEQAPRRHRRGALLRRNPRAPDPVGLAARSEEHTSELQSQFQLVCRLLLEKKNLIRATARAIKGLQNTPGRLFQRVEESCFEAWVQIYPPDKTTLNSHDSYYD